MTKSMIASLFGFALGALAQSGGTITGNVVELAGDAVAGAPIQAANATTKAVYKATSSDKGDYTLAQLPAGAYELSVAAPGFNPFAQNVTLAAAQALRLDIHLFDFQLDTLGDGREFRVSQLTPHPTPSGPTPRTAD